MAWAEDGDLSEGQDLLDGWLSDEQQLMNGVAWAGGGGNHAAAERGQALRGHRRVALERDLEAKSGAFLTPATILLCTLAFASAHPPAWVSRARDTGEQRLRALLLELLNVAAFAHAAALLLLVPFVHRLRPPFAERALAAVRTLYVAVVVLHAASVAVAGTESWGGTAAAFLTVVVGAVVAWLYALGELKGVVVKIGSFIFVSLAAAEARRSSRSPFGQMDEYLHARWRLMCRQESVSFPL